MGSYCSLAVASGKPAICYRDGANNSLKYARSSTPNGMNPGNWQAVIVDDGSGSFHDLGPGNSLAVINGFPAVSYIHQVSGNHTLKYAISSTSTGTSPADWQAITLREFATFNLLDTSLAEVAGNPAISYGIADNGGGDFGYATYTRATSSTGASPSDWALNIYVDSGASAVSLAIIDGNPAVANFVGGMDQDLHFTRSSSSAGASQADWNSMGLYTSYELGKDLSLAEINDGQSTWPAISHGGSWDDEGLYYSRSSTSSGQSEASWATLVVEPGSFGFTSIALVDGKPAISYYDWSNGDLKYAIRMGN